MQLREIRHTVFFDQVKDIRRYNYDIEDLLKENGLFGINQLVPPIPDEIEPLMDRLSIQKEIDNKSFIFKISQLSFTIAIIYNRDANLSLETEIDFIKNIQEKIKNFLKNKISSFKIIYESLSIAKEDLEKDNNKIKILEVDQNLDEKITRTSTEYENKYFIIDQISVLKTFNSNIDLNQFIFTKNKKENFVGWQVFNMKEINTRLAYNNDKDEYKELKFKEILELINY